MPSDKSNQTRTENTERASERNEKSERKNDASSAMSSDVSSEEMTNLTRTRNKNSREDAGTTALLGGLELFDEETAERNAMRAEQTNTPVPSETLTNAQFAQRAEALFDRIDTNHDQWLGADELSAAVQNRDFRDQDAQTVAALYSSRNTMQLLSRDEYSTLDDDGVTRADLQAFGRQSAARETLTPAMDVLRGEANFNRFDTDHDGYIARTELDAARQNTNLSEADRAHLQRVSDNFDNIIGASNDEWGFESSISDTDVAEYLNQTYQTVPGQTETLVSNTMSRTREGQLNQLNSNLFATPDNPLQSITPDAVVQGTIGDCYYLAAVSSLAASNPQAIRDMIRDNGNGTYTVTFPGDTANPVTINAPTDAERGLYNGGHKYGTWAGVLERAFGQYQSEHGNIFRRARVSMESGGNVPTEYAGAGGQTSWATELLTGRGTETVSSADSQLASRLERALNSDSRATVTTGINPRLFSSTSTDGYPTRHAYSITNFEPDGQGGGMVTVRNPWGANNDTTSGTTRISLQQFQNNFSDVTFEVPA
ncbi:MAG: hypothetical protein DKT66_00185 [Candidatus Melainabacteria bacterium]|nr:MAG: hypothetical protein DKT66_00185 [Candidatus Melainabacteria bacterium]